MQLLALPHFFLCPHSFQLLFPPGYLASCWLISPDSWIGLVSPTRHRLSLLVDDSHHHVVFLSGHSIFVPQLCFGSENDNAQKLLSISLWPGSLNDDLRSRSSFHSWLLNLCPLILSGGGFSNYVFHLIIFLWIVSIQFRNHFDTALPYQNPPKIKIHLKIHLKNPPKIKIHLKKILHFENCSYAFLAKEKKAFSTWTILEWYSSSSRRRNQIPWLNFRHTN